MFAVIKTGGKQYIVKEGSVLKVEKIDANVDDEVSLDNLFCYSSSSKVQDNKVTVKAKVLNHCKGEKIIVFKKKRRKNYRRKNGHRQNLTTLRIININKEGTE